MTPTPLKPLVGMRRDQLEALAESLGQPKYRGRQLAAWIYEKGARELEAMSDLPKAFRQALAAEHQVAAVQESAARVASDGTTKFLFSGADGKEIEAVWIPYPDRVTACISSQVGCAMACRFCATGQLGFERNLSVGEIVDQVVAMQAKMGRRISNVVYMGMGEPLLNLPQVLASVHALNEEVGIGMRQITISTVGIEPKIRELAQAKLQLTLALSLHAPTDELRSELVPMNAKFDLEELRAAVLDYEATTGRRVTLEYIMLDGVNDRPQDAEALIRWARGLHVHINLIPYHPTGSAYRASPPEAIQRFAQRVEAAGFPTHVRGDRGLEIEAACGQLKRQLAKGPA